MTIDDAGPRGKMTDVQHKATSTELLLAVMNGRRWLTVALLGPVTPLAIWVEPLSLKVGLVVALLSCGAASYFRLDRSYADVAKVALEGTSTAGRAERQLPAAPVSLAPGSLRRLSKAPDR